MGGAAPERAPRRAPLTRARARSCGRVRHPLAAALLLSGRYAFFLTKADHDEGWGYRIRLVTEMFSGEEPRQEKMDQTDEELHSLEIIREHFNFDEDMFYGFQKRLEDGDLGYLS